jgi:UDP-N-acetylglucosamine 3-dehydrogenase
MSNEARYRVGVIGLGSIARGHVGGYKRVQATSLVAGADAFQSQLDKFTQEIAPIQAYTNYVEMLDREHLDLVSVCTWPPLHEEMVIAAAERGVKGILCEKPMALNLGQADRMIEACDRHGVRLAVSHQRRYNKRYTEAREAVQQGLIGELLEVYGIGGSDLLSDGTHTVDMIRFLAGDEPINWLMGQVRRQVSPDVPDEPNKVMVKGAAKRYGHVVEHAAVARFLFRSGVRGIVETGDIRQTVIRGVGESLGLCPAFYQYMRLLGSEGRIEVFGDARQDDPRPTGWRILSSSRLGWEEHPTVNDNHAYACAITDLVRWIEEGGENTLDGRNARADLEVLMSIFESSRRRSRIDFPLTVSEHPLEAMIDAGEM